MKGKNFERDRKQDDIFLTTAGAAPTGEAVLEVATLQTGKTSPCRRW
jgi:hypothetical protein